MARILMRVNGKAFGRIRDHIEAHKIPEVDRQGPLRIEMQQTHVSQVRRAFATHGMTVASGPWPSWSAGYAAWRAKHSLGTKMMRLTDTLFEKAVLVSHPNFIGRFTRPFRYVLGFRDDVGYQHQRGIGHLPRRSLIDKTEADIKQFKDTLIGFWQKRIRQANRHA